MNQELIAYVKDALTQGLTADQIRQQLLTAGWDIETIDEALKEVLGGVVVEEHTGEMHRALYSERSIHPEDEPNFPPAINPPRFYGKTRIIWGIVFIVAPILLVILTFGLFSGLMSSAVNQGLESYFTVVGPAIGILAVVAVVASLFLPGIGLVLLLKKDPPVEKSGEITEENRFIYGISFGAFFGSPIWQFGNKLYAWGVIMLVSIFIPVIGQLALAVTTLVLAARGRRLAWDKGWPSLEAFKQRQKLMAKIIIAFLVIVIALLSYFAVSYYNSR